MAGLFLLIFLARVCSVELLREGTNFVRAVLGIKSASPAPPVQAIFVPEGVQVAAANAANAVGRAAKAAGGAGGAATNAAAAGAKMAQRV